MTIACVDWRDAESAAIAALHAEEIRRWSTALGWETAASWDHIERGRRLGTVPGLLALDPTGAVVGWTFYLLHRGVLQVGGFAAASEAATMVLVDGIFGSPAAAGAQSATVFVFTDAPGLSRALARHGLTVGAYDYLTKSLPDRRPPTAARTPSPRTISLPMRQDPRQDHQVLPELRRWHPRDRVAAAALLQAAYPGMDGVRPFAPQGTIAEWQEYVDQLVSAAGCGTIISDGCFVVPDGPDRVSGVVLLTQLATATAHIAQLAVDPRAHRKGLGRVLVRAACDSAERAGCRCITLLVESRNVAARGLYDAAGFGAAARFVSAGSRQPLRSTSVAVRRGATVRL